MAVPEDSALVQVLSYSEPGSLQFGLLVCRYLSKYVFTVKKKTSARRLIEIIPNKKRIILVIAKEVEYIPTDVITVVLEDALVSPQLSTPG